MSVDSATTLRASRYRVARSRGTASGVLLLLLGAWAALVPFFGPYLDTAYTPQPNTAWHWTSARGWLEVLPGGVVFLGGLLLIMSASRVVTTLSAWLAAAGGAWLLVGPTFSAPLQLDLGTPDPASRRSVQALDAFLFFYGVGALIVFIAGIGLGRLTVNSMRDLRAAERRLAADDAAAAAATPSPAAATTPAEAPVGRSGAPVAAGAAQPGQRRAGLFGRHRRREQAAPAGYPDGAPTTQQPAVGEPAAGQPNADQPTTQHSTYASAPPPPRSG